MTEIEKLYSYYLTIPPLNNWRILKKFIPEEYFKFFNNGKHLGFEDFKKEYNENIEFKEFINEFKFRRLIEDYIKRNTIFTIYATGQDSDDYYGGRYTGRYNIEVSWRDQPRPFLLQSSYISYN